MSIYTYKCPNCSGGLNFDPKSQSFTCEFCESHFNKEEMEGNKPDINQEEVSSKIEAVETAFYACPSCGAEVLTDMTTAATHCYYCHSSVVLSERLTGEFKPDEVIPFTIPKEKAIEGLMTWMKKKWFVPKVFSCQRQIEKVTGVYFPVWYVDCDIDGRLTASGTKVRTWQDSTFRYKETRFFDIERSGDIKLENIPKKALSKEESKLYESVLPFDETKAEKFSSAFLSGFCAEKRNIESKDLKQEVTDEARNYSQQLFNDTVNGYTTVNKSSYHINRMETSWKYTLLPVWTMTYKDTNKTFYYVMNGQTGKLNGELPVDRKKLGLVSGGISVFVFIILFLINRGILG